MWALLTAPPRPSSHVVPPSTFLPPCVHLVPTSNSLRILQVTWSECGVPERELLVDGDPRICPTVRINHEAYWGPCQRASRGEPCNCYLCVRVVCSHQGSALALWDACMATRHSGYWPG